MIWNQSSEQKTGKNLIIHETNFLREIYIKVMLKNFIEFQVH